MRERWAGVALVLIVCGVARALVAPPARGHPSSSVRRRPRVGTPLGATSASSTPSSGAGREDEIRRKIAELKKEGKLKPKQTLQSSEAESSSSSLLGEDSTIEKLRRSTREMKRRSAADDYAEKLGSKLGGRRGRRVGQMLGIDVPSQAKQAGEEERAGRKAKLGTLTAEDMEDFDDDDDDETFEVEALTEEERRARAEIDSEAASEAIGMLRRNIDESIKEESDEMEEEDMVDAVARALSETGGLPSRVVDAPMDDEVEEVDVDKGIPKVNMQGGSTTASTGQATSGVGGSWAPPTEPSKQEDAYQPKVGTWGAFPRPRNISVAYGGGKRVGAGVSTDKVAQQRNIESTKERLRAYREKMGIEVQSEKDHAGVIEEALELASRAMQRGSYGAGVSALEKVTQYCSTRSKLGGKVFLELAMAYEAEGKTDQAIGLYAALSKSPIEQIKMNADKLSYGLEAMNFMRNEAKLEDFSRKKAAATFIDATGFQDIAKNFDKVYNTAYIDLDKGSQYYRMLTENVVRSTREARQILLRAVSSGEVERMKVVQALRSISRHFDEALTAEKEEEEAKNVPVDYAGKPIVTRRRSAQQNLATAIGMDGFVLLTSSQTLTSLDGEWKLQLMADKKGEGVDWFNSTLMWQAIDADGMTYMAGSKGLRTSSQSGNLAFDGKERILSREGSPTSAGGGGGGLLSAFFGGAGGTAGQMSKVPQQILSVDSALLVTRAIVKAPAADNVKDYYSVWRRVDPGTYTSGG